MLSYAQQATRVCSVIDTPTAYTLEKGRYQFSFLAYDKGGVELKTFIGLHDLLYLGASFDIQNALGKEKPKPHAPGVIAKLKFTDGWEKFPISFAVGYDSFYISRATVIDNEQYIYNRMIYGPYFVVTKPIYLFDDEQHIHGGIRFPLQPDYKPKDTAYFLSFDIPMGNAFMFKTEGERIYYNFSRPNDWVLNLGFKYTYLFRFGVEFDISLKKNDRPNRLLRIEYNDEF